jgi:hypothetical protein
MTSQGSVHGRFTRAIQRRSLFAAEVALREMGNPSLLVAIDYLLLLADERPAKYPLAALRWHGRLEGSKHRRSPRVERLPSWQPLKGSRRSL